MKVKIVPIFQDVGASREIRFDETQRKVLNVLKDFALLMKKSLYDFKVVDIKQYTLTYISAIPKVAPYGIEKDFYVEFTLPDDIEFKDVVNYLKSELGTGYEIEGF